MDGQLAVADVLVGDGLVQEPPSQGGGLSFGDHPADRVAAVDVQDRVQLVVGPFGRAEQFREIPGPHPVGRSGDQLRLHRGRVGGLAAPLGHLASAPKTRYMVEIEAR